MKKSLIILPLASLMLAGCQLPLPFGPQPTSTPTSEPTSQPTSEPTSEPTSAPTSTPTSEPTSVPTSVPTSEPTSEPTSVPTSVPTSAPTSQPTSASTSAKPPQPTVSSTSIDYGPEEWQGYRKVLTAPVDGKEYIYGIYQRNNGNMIFLNGDHHRDEKGEYPYYLTTSHDVADAVKIVCEYTDDTHFTIKIVGGGQYQTYDGKYLEIYSGEKADGTKITSLRAGDTAGSWYFLEEYEGIEVKSNVQDLDDGSGHGSQPVGMSTYDAYETFSACTPNHFGNNFISHLWEPAIE